MSNARTHKTAAKPKRRDKHYSYDESVNESAKLIEDEPVEIQGSVPVEEKRPIENIEAEDKPESPLFEE
jgi:hypothetical protein